MVLLSYIARDTLLSQDLLAQFFMGRLVPLANKELQLSYKIGAWADDDTLRFLAQGGHDAHGNLVVGNESYWGPLTVQPGYGEIIECEDSCLSVYSAWRNA